MAMNHFSISVYVKPNCLDPMVLDLTIWAFGSPHCIYTPFAFNDELGELKQLVNPTCSVFVMIHFTEVSNSFTLFVGYLMQPPLNLSFAVAP